MTARDIATISFRTLAAWLVASGVAGLCSGLFTWAHDVGEYGRETAIFSLASGAILIPIGAIWWLLSDWVAGRVLPGRSEPLGLALTRADLYAFASVLVGLLLLADALPQIVYWAISWRGSRGTGFWSPPAADSQDNASIHWLSVRAQLGSVAAKLVLGLLFVSGPDRVKNLLLRIRREFSTHLTEPEAEPDKQPPRDHGGA
jgi:hypothetical protein